MAIDTQMLVLIRDSVAWQTDHALDVIERRIFRVAKHHDITALRFIDADDLLVDDRQANAVGKFIDQDEVAHQQGRNHRA